MSSHLDARDPLVIDTHELVRQAGAMRRLRDTVEAPADLGIEVIGVPEGAPMHLDLTLESVVEGVLVTGSVQVPLTGECSRCLEPIADSGTYRITELYNYPGRGGADDELFLEGDLLDLEPAVRAAIVLELPFSPLCRPDCRGLCPSCGADLNDDPDHAHEADIDPRWRELAGLGRDLPAADPADNED